MPGIHEEASDEDVFEFDCPECGVHIVGEVTKCPKCGTEFVIEEVEDVPTAECPPLPRRGPDGVEIMPLVR